MVEARRISGPLVGGWTRKQVRVGGKKAGIKVRGMLRRKRLRRWRRGAAMQQGRIRALLLLDPLLLTTRARRPEGQEEDVWALLGIVVEALPVVAAVAAAVALVGGVKVGEVVGEKAAAAGEAGCR